MTHSGSSPLDQPVRTAAVLGAGVMGAAISAHLANAGIPNLLLDIKPSDLSEAESAQGLTLDDPRVANRFAAAGLARARKSQPASFYSSSLSQRIEIGNLDDDLSKLATVDWVIEAVVENLDIKRSLFEKVAAHLGPDAVITSNTSGLSAEALSECLPEELRSRFLVTHFFNPPRYLHLLELVRGPQTDPKVYDRLAAVGEYQLGKGIVHAKDTPNFIANRVGTFAMLHALGLLSEGGYSVAEIDRLTGKAIGRPKSATFRTADIVGLDTLAHVAANMEQNLPNDPERDLFVPPTFVGKMIENRWLGAKSGQGFYKKTKTQGRTEILMLDPATLEYVSQPKVQFPSLEMGKSVEDLGDRLKMLVQAPDRAGEFLWKNLSATLRYAASVIPEVSDDVVNIDRALRWGFGWEMGPFEVWDALGVSKTVARMEKEGQTVPTFVGDMLESGAGSFYQRSDGVTQYFDVSTKAAQPVPFGPRALRLDDRKARQKVVEENADASLVDLGDAVLGLEFHTKMNAIGPGIIQAIERGIELAEADWRGLVIANEAENFCVGANLLLILNELDDENYDDVDWMVRKFQDVNQRIRFSSRPVVVAPHGLTLGGGCEITLAADRVAASAETYIGLVEVGAGIIPAGGGCKELIKRIHLSQPEGIGVDLFPFVRKVFETAGAAKVATSAVEARELGYLRDGDEVVLNPDHRIYEAKTKVLALDLDGYDPGLPLEDIRVVGEPGLAAIRAGLHNMRASGFISEYDEKIGDRLAWVLCGGEVSASSRVSEQYLLDLEREAFLALCENEQTLARMEHILKTGKPLRN